MWKKPIQHRRKRKNGAVHDGIDQTAITAAVAAHGGGSRVLNSLAYARDAIRGYGLRAEAKQKHEGNESRKLKIYPVTYDK